MAGSLAGEGPSPSTSGALPAACSTVPGYTRFTFLVPLASPRENWSNSSPCANAQAPSAPRVPGTDDSCFLTVPVLDPVSSRSVPGHSWPRVKLAQDFHRAAVPGLAHRKARR